MANKAYDETAIQAIADAIRAKNGATDTYTVAQMATAINDLQMNLDFEVPHAGAYGGQATIPEFECSHPSYIGSIQTSDSVWWNLISCRHRNNSGDGVNFGMALFAPLFGGNLQWHQQTGAGTWGADRTIWDSGNSLQTSSGGGNDSAYVRIGNMQICWGAINITMNISTATGNSYYGEWSGDHAFAAPFNSGCWPNISLLSESTLVKSVGLEQRSYAGIQKILAFDSRPRTNQQFYVHYIACGWV